MFRGHHKKTPVLMSRLVLIKEKTMKKINQMISMVALSSLLLACSSESTQVNKNITKEVMVNGGKTGAPIEMQYKILTQSPKAGEEIEVQVQFNSRVKAPVQIEMSPDKKLTLLSDTKNLQSTLNKSGIREAMPVIKVMAAEDGIYYIHLIASVEENNSIMAKPFTIAVRVGDAQKVLEEVGEVITDEKGQKIIIQEAETEEKP